MRRFLAVFFSFFLLTGTVFADGSVVQWVKIAENSALHLKWQNDSTANPPYYCRITVGFQGSTINYNVYDYGCGGSGDNYITPSFTWSADTWYKVEVVQTGGTYELFIDDDSQGTVSAQDINMPVLYLQDETEAEGCPYYLASNSECSATNPVSENPIATSTGTTTPPIVGDIVFGLAIIIMILTFIMLGFIYNGLFKTKVWH